MWIIAPSCVMRNDWRTTRCALKGHFSGRSSPVNAKLRFSPPLLPCSKALPAPAAAPPEEAGEAPASSSAGSRPAADVAACALYAAAARPRCTPVMPSASWAVGAQSTCSRVLPCILSAYTDISRSLKSVVSLRKPSMEPGKPRVNYAYTPVRQCQLACTLCDQNRRPAFREACQLCEERSKRAADTSFLLPAPLHMQVHADLAGTLFHVYDS